MVNTLTLVQAFAEMETTQQISVEFDKIVAEIGSTNGTTQELVACVLLAQLRSGKATITMVNTH